MSLEKDFYKKWNFEVEYVGHPLVEVIEEFKAQHPAATVNSVKKPDTDLPVIALLPGSRKQEILIKLPVMLEVAKFFPAYKFIVAKAPGLPGEFYDDLLKPYKNVSAVVNKTYELLNNAKAALVTSGTATLETALFAVPEIICYKGGNISYQIAKRLIKIKYIGLVNLIMDKEVVKELIQDDLSVNNIVIELKKLLEDTATRQQVKQDYDKLKDILGKGGHASANAAKSIYGFLQNQLPQQ